MLNTFQIRNKCFKASLLSLNYEKTQCFQFTTKKCRPTNTNIITGNNIISNVSHTKFLVQFVDNTFFLSTHVEGTVYNLSFVGYMFRSFKPCMSHSSLIMIYYALFHSILSHGVIFWVKS